MYANYRMAGMTVSELALIGNRRIAVRKHTVFGLKTDVRTHAIDDIELVNRTPQALMCVCKSTQERFTFDPDPRIEKLFALGRGEVDSLQQSHSSLPGLSNVGGTTDKEAVRFEKKLRDKHNARKRGD